MILNWQLDSAADTWLTSLMQHAADTALRCEGVTLPCSVDIRLCSDEAIREINRAYRGIDKATDVLSFPLNTYPAGRTAGNAPKHLQMNYDDETGACALGDLIISTEHILSQAKEYGHSPQREAAYLLVHGLCHLFGYDHIEDDDKRRMREMEEKILSEIGIGRDETQIPNETLLQMAREMLKRSYCPYSHYAVGAAILADDGRIFTGCNIENASYGLTNCAERTAVFKAVSEGATSFTAIAIAAYDAAPWPCGACRQVLNEFAPGIRVLVTWGDHVEEAPLSALLPHGFGPNELPQTDH